MDNPIKPISDTSDDDLLEEWRCQFNLGRNNKPEYDKLRMQALSAEIARRRLLKAPTS